VRGERRICQVRAYPPGEDEEEGAEDQRPDDTVGDELERTRGSGGCEEEGDELPRCR
jgi:hypothetical protein